ASAKLQYWFTFAIRAPSASAWGLSRPHFGSHALALGARFCGKVNHDPNSLWRRNRTRVCSRREPSRAAVVRETLHERVDILKVDGVVTVDVGGADETVGVGRAVIIDRDQCQHEPIDVAKRDGAVAIHVREQCRAAARYMGAPNGVARAAGERQTVGRN